MCDVAWPSSTSNRTWKASRFCTPATDGRAMAPAWAYGRMGGRAPIWMVWRGSIIDKSIDRPAMDRMNG